MATIRRIIADDERKTPSLPVGARREGVLDLTEAIAEDGSVRTLMPRLVAEARPVGSGERIEPAPPRPTPPEDKAEPVAEPALALTDPLPAETGTAAELRRGAGDRTLEDVVGDLLRPLLRAWLDEHLPAVIEKLARDEVARAVAAED